MKRKFKGSQFINNNQQIKQKQIMPTTKSFKINIESIVPINIDGLDLSMVRVEIKNNQGNIIKTVPLNQLTQTIINIEAQAKIVMVFSLLQSNNMGSRQPRPFAQGTITVQTIQFQKEHNFAVGCSIKNIINKKTVISLAVIIKEDLQKRTYEIPDSQGSFVQEQQIQQQKQKTVSQIFPTPRQKTPQPKPQPQIKKFSPIKRNTKRPIRNRHSQYILKSQTPKVKLINKIVDDHSLLFQDLKIQLDEPIASLQFFGSTYQEMLAQVHFSSNPTQLQLKNLKIKIPENQKTIDIHLKTLQGVKLLASTNLRNLQENQCVKISCNFKDQKNTIKGKMKFNFKQNSNDNQSKNQKMQMAPEIRIFDRKKLIDQIQSISYLFPEQKQKLQQQHYSQNSPRFKLPNIYRKQPKFEFQAISQTIVPPLKTEPIQNNSVAQSSKYEAPPKTYRDKNNQIEKNQINRNWQLKLNDNQTILRRRSRTINQKSYGSEHQQKIQPKRILTTILPPQVKKSIIKITGVSVKFYKSYLQTKNTTYSGKFLQIYSNQKKIYRSEPAYAASTLNWKLPYCQIQISQYDNLTFELNIQKQKTLVGELIISYNQLKFNQQQNSLYFGYLTSNYEVIAKICIEFILSSFNQIKGEGIIFQPIQRKTRMKRLYSEDIAYVGNQQHIKRQNHSKTSLRQSVAIPFPEGIRKQKLFEQQKQLQTIRQKKKRKVRSPIRRQKYI